MNGNLSRSPVVGLTMGEVRLPLQSSVYILLRRLHSLDINKPY